MKTTVASVAVLVASSAFGQTLPDFSRAVLQPLSIKATEDEAQHKRAALATACASPKPKDWGAVLGLINPALKEALSDPPDHAQFCSLMLDVLREQTASRIAARVADLELKTTAKTIDGTLIFSVCHEKTARQWKALAGGTFQQQGDVPC